MGNGLSIYMAWVVVFVTVIHLTGEWRRWRESTTTLRLPTGTTIRVDVANTPEARSRGLSGAGSLLVDGLLLQWPEAGHRPIWMADMRFPLDLVWLDNEGRVLAVVPAAQPCTAQPCPLLDPPAARGTTQAVLELDAGAAASHQLGVGTRVLLSWSVQ